MEFSLLSALAIVGLLGVVVAALLRAFGVAWSKGLVIGLVVLPLLLATGAGLTYVSVIVIKTLKLQVGGLLFGGIATMVLVSAGGVAMSKNILYSGFFLMGTLIGVAGLYLFIGADFVGIAQLLIYIGGILVLILFAVLLTNRITDVKVSNRSADAKFLGMAATVSFFVFAIIAYMILKTPWAATEAVAAPSTTRIGDAFLREYLLPFELISLVLLMALVGAMVIARRAAKDAAADAEDAPGLDRLE